MLYAHFSWDDTLENNLPCWCVYHNSMSFKWAGQAVTYLAGMCRVRMNINIYTSTVYWCIASKLKAPWNLYYWMSNMFSWVEIFISFVCYHVGPKRHSQLGYELNDLSNKRKLKTTRWKCFFFWYLLRRWVWSRLTNWHSSTSNSSGMSVLITESIYWAKTSRVPQLIS